MEERVRRKLAQAAASVGVEESPIPGGPRREQSFAETRREIERLQEEDPTIYEEGGTPSAAQTGEEYRQELRQALESRREEIEQLPWKAGSGLVKGQQRGHFFCARVGERIYLRFVPWQATEASIESELGTCLRLIECTETTERSMPQDLAAGAYDAWAQARQHIWQSWMWETDPANLEPRLPKVNREVAAHLREFRPEGVEEERLRRALEAVEAPCPTRDQRLLRERLQAECASPYENSRALVSTIEELGLLPYERPSPLPPVTEDQIHLVCWMAIEAERDARTYSRTSRSSRSVQVK
ncbi:MAG: hypothetical protein ACREGK_04770 [Geminicoccales bacterium]